MTPEWDARYPDQEALRGEVDLMADAFVEALLEEVPANQIRTIYLKGSACKPWDSPLDYVPEVSDLDIHVHFRGDEHWRGFSSSLQKAMRIQKRVETLFLSQTVQPVHTPRPQLIVLNAAERKPDWVDAPRSTVRVLHGEEYPQVEYSDSDRIRRGECDRLLTDASYVRHVPLQIIDRPLRYLWEVMRALVWRVSPAGPRVLHISGVDTESAWSMNRTGVVDALREIGLDALAEPYTSFYLSAWRYFLSGYADTDAGRDAISSAVEVLQEAEQVANSWLDANPAEPAG